MGRYQSSRVQRLRDLSLEGRKEGTATSCVIRTQIVVLRHRLSLRREYDDSGDDLHMNVSRRTTRMKASLCRSASLKSTRSAKPAS